MPLDERSRRRLEGAHPDLRRVIELAAAQSEIEFVVIEVSRTSERQAELVRTGASKTMRSRHIPRLTAQFGIKAHACDLACKVAGQIRWDWPLYERLAQIVKQAAADAGVAIEWGGDWTTFKDGPHFQLPWSQYPCVGA